MSDRMIKMGNRVWNAAKFCAAKGGGNARTGIVTAGEVAKQAGVSIVTARKYLKMAVERGAISSYDVQYAPTTLFVFEGE